MEILKILEQIAMLPVKAAQAILDLLRKGTSVPINMTLTIEGKKVGLETRAFLFEDEAKKGQGREQAPGQQGQPGQP